MSIAGISYSSNCPSYFSQLTVQLADSPQGRYTIVRAPIIPDRPVPPSLPTIAPLSLPNAEKIKAVPEELQEDPFFQKNADPISFEPLFDPVADRNQLKHIYERATITQWLQNHNTSPLTRGRMTVADLVPVPELKKQINAKIHDHLLQQHPELLKKHQEKVQEATTRYQEALRYHHEVDLVQYENMCRNLTCGERVFRVAKRCFDGFRGLFDQTFNELQKLQGTVSALSVSNPLTSLVQSVARTVLRAS